jgi:hypothetical protein
VLHVFSKGNIVTPVGTVVLLLQMAFQPAVGISLAYTISPDHQRRSYTIGRQHTVCMTLN